MENASKALIIAGAILISILLIGVGVMERRRGNRNYKKVLLWKMWKRY